MEQITIDRTMDWQPLKHRRELKLLSTMERQRFRELMDISSAPILEPRNVIFKEGTAAMHLHIVLSGGVELFGASQRKEASIAVLQPGESFILAAVVTSGPTLMAARTIARSQILFIPAEAFRAAMRRDPALALAVTEELGLNFRCMVRQLRNQKLRSGKQRLAAYLLLLQRQQGRRDGISLAVKKRTLASLLGLEPETLSRAFAELRTEGVEVHGDEVLLPDVRKLEELVGPDWSIEDPEA